MNDKIIYVYKCPKCLKWVTRGTNFCPDCGFKFVWCIKEDQDEKKKGEQ